MNTMLNTAVKNTPQNGQNGQNTSPICIGLDVSKDTLDACLLICQKRHEKQFVNEESGHAKLLSWAQGLAGQSPCHFCLEATGPYSQSVALFLVEKQQAVSVVNPARPPRGIRFFALAQNAGTKQTRPTHA